MRLRKVLFAGLMGVLASLLALGLGASARADYTFWTPPWTISIVWPQDGRGNPTSIDKSQTVNVTLWPSHQQGCLDNPGLALWVAKDNEPAQPVGNGQLVQRTVDGRTFPTLEYNNVPADLTAEPTAKYRFFVPVLEISNVWVHAADPRTFFPQQVIPAGYSEQRPDQLDVRIQIVWPHDKAGQFTPVDRAQFVNIAIDLFDHGTLLSVPVDYSPKSMTLLVARQSDPVSALYDVQPQKSLYTVNGLTFPRWTFNDVPVQPGEQYHFLVNVVAPGEFSPSRFTSIWTHAVDARTILPNPMPPPPCQQ